MTHVGWEMKEISQKKNRRFFDIVKPLQWFSTLETWRPTKLNGNILSDHHILSRGFSNAKVTYFVILLIFQLINLTFY